MAIIFKKKEAPVAAVLAKPVQPMATPKGPGLKLNKPMMTATAHEPAGLSAEQQLAAEEAAEEAANEEKKAAMKAKQAAAAAAAPAQGSPFKKSGLSFGKKPMQPSQASAPAVSAGPSTGLKKSLSFLKTGAAAQSAFEKEELKSTLKSKGVRDYWIPKNSEGKLTFLDGEVKDGILQIPFYHQHTINMNGDYNDFICTQDDEPCPICEGGDQPSLVGLLTVIDNHEWTSQKDGKVYKDQVKKFVCKRNTYKQLVKIAAKRGGLTGATFDVSRTGEKEPRVGNVFDFTEKHTLGELQKMYGSKEKIIAPINYGEMMAGMYLSAKELRKLGFGNMGTPMGEESGVQDDESTAAEYASSM